MKSQNLIAGIALIGLSILVSCNKDSGSISPVAPVIKPPDDIALDQARIKKEDVAKVLKCQSLSMSYYRSEGGVSMANIGPMLLTLGGKELDFDALKDLSFSFDHGLYESTYKEDRLRFVFFFADQFGTFNPGDTIPYHLFAVNSYIRNITIDWKGIHFDKGPLFDLITGAVRFDGFKPIVTIGAERLLFTMEYRGVSKLRQPDGSIDTLQIFLRTEKTNVQSLADQLKGAGYSFNIDSTRYNSQYYSAEAVIDASRITIRKQDAGFLVNGQMSGRIIHNGLWYYFNAAYSGNGENSTDYYLTADMTRAVGIARLSGDFQSGLFTTTAGDTLAYRLP